MTITLILISLKLIIINVADLTDVFLLKVYRKNVLILNNILINLCAKYLLYLYEFNQDYDSLVCYDYDNRIMKRFQRKSHIIDD